MTGQFTGHSRTLMVKTPYGFRFLDMFTIKNQSIDELDLAIFRYCQEFRWSFFGRSGHLKKVPKNIATDGEVFGEFPVSRACVRSCPLASRDNYCSYKICTTPLPCMCNILRGVLLFFGKIMQDSSFGSDLFFPSLANSGDFKLKSHQNLIKIT